ncbi:MAG: hypoxanthine phosphoribosyltransferase [Bacillota bacterium]|nr:hypoxanthine phosphoribosyltransferase [Thermoanaerobacteraceae bacterium]
MHPDIERVLLAREEIQERVRLLGTQISADYKGKEILAVGVLKGSVVFLADLLRVLTVPVEIDFIAVSSYGKASASSGVVRILKDLDRSITGRDVLLVEDIVDTGLTLNYLKEHLLSQQPAGLRVCALLDKPSRRRVPVEIDYLGFSIPDEFVVGYGLDYAGRYRNLPDICVLRREVYEGGR